jgi:type I restriction enzyme M protein
MAAGDREWQDVRYFVGDGMAWKRQQPTNGAGLGFEEKLWLAADKLRGHMDAAEYKHVVLARVRRLPGPVPGVADARHPSGT